MDTTLVTHTPFFGYINLLNLDQITNNPISHNDDWEDMPHKLPYNLPKFKGNMRDNPNIHITTYYLWCVSNNLKDNVIRTKKF